MIHSTEIKQIAILGAGTMGAGIAQGCLQAGYTVSLFDVSEASLDKAKESIGQGLKKAFDKNKITQAQYQKASSQCAYYANVGDAVSDADLVIEAVFEDLALKQSVFEQAYKNCSNPHVIWASNTSSISITAIGKNCPDPANFAGLHFFNPVPVMPLVEIIQASGTSGETLNALVVFVESLGKTAVIAKDTPGFIVNRVARPFYGEALKILGEYGETPEIVVSVDTVMRQCGNFKMGPFELMDLIGIDVNLAVTQSVYAAYFSEPRYQPHAIQQAKVHAGQLGRKTQKGFYDYA